MDAGAPNGQRQEHHRAACPDPLAHVAKAIRSIPNQVLDQAASASGSSPTSDDEAAS